MFWLCTGNHSVGWRMEGAAKGSQVKKVPEMWDEATISTGSFVGRFPRSM